MAQMDQMPRQLAFQTGQNSLPTKRENSNVQRVIDARMMLSEALEAVDLMLRGYPSRSQAGDSYLGAIAQLLMSYPRQVAIACTDPLHGVVRETRFLPTPADVIGWCEKRCAPLFEEGDRERRITDQIRARDEWATKTISDRLKSAGKSWLDRTDPVAQSLSAGEDGDQKARREALVEKIQIANQKGLERECAHAGIDLARGVSPSLLKKTGGT